MGISKAEMYHFPWSSNDNPIGWLEITDKCNIYCRGCYRMNGHAGHKPLEQVKEEINLLREWRNIDNVSIAGGEPLLHPDILDIIAYIREQGIKPLLLTNGLRLKDNMPLLRDLKKAGVFGFTFHIDSEQNRPHYKGKTELELCELRLEYAHMVAEVGGLYSSFGMTVYPTNVDLVPQIVAWANRHIDLIQGLVFITFRGAPMDGTFNYFVNGRPLAATDLTYTVEDQSETYIRSTDVAEKIQQVHPHYAPAAYLGGTQSHTRTTWLSGVQVGTKNKMYGSIGAKGMEAIQTGYHFFNGQYPVYMRRGKLPKIAFLLAGIDKGLRKIHANYWRQILRNPLNFFRPLYVQSIGIIQGPDFLEDGRLDMCESCPDMTVWDGKLVHSCRMDEWRLYGGYVEASRNPDFVPLESIGTAPAVAKLQQN